MQKLPLDTLYTLDSGRCYVIPTLPARPSLRGLSAGAKGFLHVGKYHLTHNPCSGPGIVYLLAEDDDGNDIPARIQSARLATRTLTCREHVGWTYAQMARHITDWLDIRQQPLADPKRLVPHWHYRLCRPYELPYAALYDMSAAYWQIACRAESPTFDLMDDAILWRRLTREQEQRWNTLRTCFAENAALKPLRLALIGVNAAGRNDDHANEIAHSTQCWHQGKPYPGYHNRPGALQPLSLLAVRCTYELTQIQSEMAQSYYSNADCVVSADAARMDYWDFWQIEYKKKHEGRTYINAIGSYSIGSTATKPWHEDGFILAHKPKRLPDPYLHTKILKISSPTP